MKNKQYYLAERNNYFFGKLMTVRDFESEQNYFNSKRRLGNRMLNGSGIVSGLDVILVDNKTFSLEPGMALDYMGREIVVHEPYVRRLNVIEGFEENKDKGIVYLCIKYDEEFKETTFSVAGSGKSSGVSEEYNRINEGYKLFLTDKKPPEDINLERFVTSKTVIYDENGIKITALTPKYVNPNSRIKVKIIFEKEGVEAPVSYNFNICGEFFKSIDDEDETSISYKETEISTFKSVSKDYKIFCNAVSDAAGEFVIDKKSFVLKIGTDEIRMQTDLKIPVTISTEPLKNIIIKDYYATNFMDKIEDVEDKFIYLAKIHLVSNQLNYFIESFEKHPFDQYIYSNELLGLLQNVEDPKEVSSQEVKVVHDSSEVPQVVELPDVKADNIVTGVERINLGFSPKVGKSYYSYEFVHGLGEGNVAVITAIDNKANYLTDDKGLLVFGDKGIFSKEEITVSAPNVKIGAIVNSKKGTVRLGIRLREKTTAQAVDIRWWAFKPTEIRDEEEDLVIDENVRVVITPNTTRVKPLEQVRFEAHIEGSISQEVRWDMAEENAGTIDNNGLYTAPSKEGVYEIKAYSVKFENKSDTAYVVVSSTD